MPFGFGPEARLSDRRDFRLVFEAGRKVVGRNMILWYAERSSAAPTRLGLSVGSKVGIAVRRNRLKRLVREAFRLNRARLLEGRDIVVYLRHRCRWQSLKDVETEMMDLCRKGGLLKA